MYYSLKNYDWIWYTFLSYCAFFPFEAKIPKYLAYTMLAFIGYFYLLSQRRNFAFREALLLVMAFLCYGARFFASVFNGYYTPGIPFGLVINMGFVLFCMWGWNHKDSLIRGMYIYFFCITIACIVKELFLSELIVRDVYTAHAFTGIFVNRNHTAFYMAVASCVSYLYSQNKYGRLRGIPCLLAIIQGLLVILTGSATGYMFLIINALFLLCVRKGSYWFVWTGYCLSLGMLFFYSVNQKFFLFDLITKVLGRTPTLTNRTPRWEIALQLIKDKLFMGYGSQDVFNGQLSEELFNGVLYTHNTVLEILLHGGLFYCSAILLLILVGIYTINKKTNRSSLSFIILLIFNICIIESITENSAFGNIFVLFLCAGYMPQKLEERVKYDKKRAVF